VLSRIAQSLYWIGRYVERAEDTARILDVHLHQLLEDPWVDEQRSCRALLEVMGVTVDGDEEVDVSRVTATLAFDPANPSSIVGSLRAARENARGAREAISSEMWECLNSTYNALPDHAAVVMGANITGFFDLIKERAAVLAGLADSTMSRDEGWLFLCLGRSLERVDMTARLLAARHGEPTESPEWVTTLRSCSAHEAYRRTYRRAVDASLVIEFLLLDRLFPRSVVHALSTAESCIAELDPRPVGRVGFTDEAARVLGRARTRLEFRQARELMRDLPNQLEAVQEDCCEAARLVTSRYFGNADILVWSSEPIEAVAAS
jgi:uncharacterized alpha-E superfamily protein